MSFNLGALLRVVFIIDTELSRPFGRYVHFSHFFGGGGAKDLWYLPEISSACSGVVMYPYVEGTG
jgi:hypothetical protein